MSSCILYKFLCTDFEFLKLVNFGDSFSAFWTELITKSEDIHTKFIFFQNTVAHLGSTPEYLWIHGPATGTARLRGPPPEEGDVRAPPRGGQWCVGHLWLATLRAKLRPGSQSYPTLTKHLYIYINYKKFIYYDTIQPEINKSLTPLPIFPAFFFLQTLIYVNIHFTHSL